MNAQTLAEIHNQTGVSLWQFLASVPGSMEAQILYALVLGAMIGMIAHYARRWASGEIAGNLFDYLMFQHPRATVFAVGGIVTELIAEVGTSLFTTDSGAFVGWGLVILSGLKTGYMGDSIANKGSRPVWTEEQRTATLTRDTQSTPDPTGPVPPATT